MNAALAVPASIALEQRLGLLAQDLQLQSMVPAKRRGNIRVFHPSLCSLFDPLDGLCQPLACLIRMAEAMVGHGEEEPVESVASVRVRFPGVVYGFNRGFKSACPVAGGPEGLEVVPVLGTGGGVLLR